MSLFDGGGGGQKPDKLFGVKLNQSELGYPWTAGMGTIRVRQNILWVDNFQAIKQAASGGKGGGSNSYSYVYTADVIAGLMGGAITGIGDIWTGTSWLGNPHAIESFAITSGNTTYTPNNAANLQNDLGVSLLTPVSGTYNDYGAPTPTTLSGTVYAPMQRVAYGSSILAGQYSVSTSGVYNFSSANAGSTVQLNYSYSLTTENQQENDIIPTGKTISVGGNQKFASDLGVVYTTGANQGVALNKISGTPTTTGTYSVSGSAPATYRFAAGDVGVEVTITFQVTDPNAVATGEASTLNFTLAKGAIGQSPYSFLSSSYPGAALGYSGISTLLYQPMWLGSSGDLAQNTVEVTTADVYGGGILDCNLVQCLKQVLTNQQWGLGVGAVPFPASIIDTATWGAAPSTPGAVQAGTTAWDWSAANNFFISPCIESQDSAASEMSKWLEAGMCAAYMSEGLLKLAPYGDTTTSANGCTWIAPSTYVVALDDSCFLAKEGEDPVKITRSPWQDAYNVTQVQWENRANQYASEITQESDQALINRYGERREDPQSWDFIHTLAAATFAANMRLKHGTTVRNTYEFSLPYTYSYLEPMDIVPISTTSAWAQGLNNVNLGVVNLPVRITKIVDDPDTGLQVTSEDYAYGSHQPTIYNKQLSSGDVVANAYADPGSVEAILFEATSRLTGYTGNQIWIGACGASANYGSCNIWVSQDGSTYQEIGSINQPARLGTLVSTFGGAADPDTTDTLVVQLAENCPALSAGSHADADSGNTLCFVDGEVVAYSSCSVTGQNIYSMGSYIRRGQMATNASIHAAGSLFLRLDNSVFKYSYDPSWKGKTLYFKFQAVNTFGNCPQALSGISAVQFTVPGNNPGTIDASTGLVTATQIVFPRPIGNPPIRILPIGSVGVTLDDMMPLEQGAEATTGKSLTVLTDRHLGNIADGGGFARVTSTRVNAGRPVVDLSENIHANVGLLATQNQVNGGNLVTNGDFERGNKDNWSGLTNSPAGDSTASAAYSYLTSIHENMIPDNAIPVNPNARYYFEARLKQASGSSTHYLGFGCYDASGNNIPTQPSGLTYNYGCLLNQTPPSSWTVYTGIINGIEASGDHSIAPNDSKHTSEWKFRYGTAYIRPVLLANYSGSGTIAVDYIKIAQLPQYGDGTYVDDLKPAESGAEKTTGKSIDILADGSTYARTIATRLSAGKPLIDFSEAIHLNKNIDNVGDGSTYARTVSSRLSSGKPLIDFSEAIHLNKHLGNVPDGGGRYGASEAGANVTNAHVITATSSPSSDTAINVASYTAVNGLGWSANTANTGDVYNISGLLSYSYTGTGSVVFAVVVDSNTSSPLFTVSHSSSGLVPFFASITGLSVGSHTIKIYAKTAPNSGTIYLTVWQAETLLMCQRIF